ncbi:MAG: hypothetical protein WEF50_05045 [Myxococcota bacterium]
MLVLATASLPTLASGASVRWNIQAPVRRLDLDPDDGELAATLSSLGAMAGAEFRVSIQFQTAAVDIDLDPDRSEYYRDVIEVMDVSIGGVSLHLDPRPPPRAGPKVSVSSSELESRERITGHRVDPTGPFDPCMLAGLEPFTFDSTDFSTDAVLTVEPDVASLLP